MSPRFVLGRENVPCVAEVVNRSLKADCTDFTQLYDCNLVFIFKLAWIFNFQPLFDFFSVHLQFQNNKRYHQQRKVSNFGFEPMPVVSLRLPAHCNVPVMINGLI